MVNADLSKFTSGKFLITIIVGIVYAYVSMKGILPIDKIQEITLIVIYAYFTKQKENGGAK
ncbi:MAG: hypothetical protein PHY56_07850 [Candidatus Omnitrophica bacterium]|nr:hypothetical protein [Candidatus Omnitrophota bacterium]